MISSANLFSQDNSQKSGAYYCSLKKIHNPNILKFGPESQNSPRHSFKMLDTKMSVDLYSNFISPYPMTYKANILDKFRVDSTLNNIKLDAVNSSLGIDSVRLYPSNAVLTFTQVSDILTINLDRTYNPGEVAYVKIYYRHLNIYDNAFYCSSGGAFTDCEPEGARKWFPCWDKPSDKATYDITIKVPSNVRIGSNGRLNDSTLTGDSLYYHWVSRDPIASYLVVMTGKVNYNMRILYWHKISNPGDSIQMRHYYNSGEDITPSSNVILDMTTFYSQKFGEYPFEKGGFTTAPTSGFFWGGMENQTLITFCPGCWGANLTSHEYAHQWFGDMITCATWADIWLNEGFATYCEALWYEHTSGYSSYKNTIIGDATSYIGEGNWRPIYVPYWVNHTPGVDSLFDYGVTYLKGACVMHMLRYVLGDTLFFQAYHNYGTDTTNFKYKSATSADFNSMWNQYTGQNLDWFFNEWIFQPAHPVYANTYNFTNVGGNQWRVKFFAIQTQTNTPFHKMPITLQISFTAGSDTVIKVMNDVNNQGYIYNFYRQPTGITFDPNNDIVLKQASLTLGIGGNENTLPDKFELYQNFPNPFNPVTVIRYDIPNNAFVILKIYDITGKLVKTLVNEIKVAGRYEETFNGVNLASGIYFYKIEAGNFTDEKKLVLIK